MDALIHVYTLARNSFGETVEENKNEYCGTFEPKKDGFEIGYTEYLSDDAENRVETEINVFARPGKVILRRKGPYSMILSFERGQRFETLYQTPFGGFSMSLFTREVVVEPENGLIRVTYEMHSGDDLLVHYMEILSDDESDLDAETGAQTLETVPGTDEGEFPF
ncbi:MAG: DUF1934 domain-containing protein [Clostridia bacterium]|nr:DUF1934 domain-containing protein [Clostridia bacterium]